MIKDTWLDRNVVKPLAEGGGVASSSQVDGVGSRIARGGPASDWRHAEMGQSSRARPSSTHASTYGHRSGAMTDRYSGGAGGERRSVADRGGRDLVEHLRSLEVSLRDREGRSLESKKYSPDQDSRRQWEQDAGAGWEKERVRDRDRDRSWHHAKHSSPKEYQKGPTATLASRLASPRDVRDLESRSHLQGLESKSYLQGMASPQGVPSRPRSEATHSTLSRAGLLASPRAPPGMRVFTQDCVSIPKTAIGISSVN